MAVESKSSIIRQNEVCGTFDGAYNAGMAETVHQLRRDEGDAVRGGGRGALRGECRRGDPPETLRQF